MRSRILNPIFQWKYRLETAVHINTYIKNHSTVSKYLGTESPTQNPTSLLKGASKLTEIWT